MSLPCSRLFEVEAARDGRLTGPELESFERHAARCPTCAREIRALDVLANSLRAHTGDPSQADDLHIRRERTRLLSAYDSLLLVPEPRKISLRLLLPAAVAMLVVGFFVMHRKRAPIEPSALASGAMIRADEVAVWSDHVEAGRETVVLERGALWIHVDHTAARPPLFVVLPDGELEDTGTTFMVSVEGTHTTHVDVSEGHVVLRLHDQAMVALGAGEAWTPSPAAVPSSSAVASAAPSPDRTADTPVRATNGIAPTSPASARVDSSSPMSDPSVDFRAAMAALDVGDNHQAAAAFANFLDAYPADSRAEDAAYLRVIALQRSGDANGTKQAALEYLRSYPTGFRRAEVEQLSRQ